MPRKKPNAPPVSPTKSTHASAVNLEFSTFNWEKVETRTGRALRPVTFNSERK